MSTSKRRSHGRPRENRSRQRPHKQEGQRAPGRILRVLHKDFKQGLYANDLTEALSLLDDKGIVSKTRVSDAHQRHHLIRLALEKLVENGEVIAEANRGRYVLSPEAFRLEERLHHERIAQRTARRYGWDAAAA